MQFCHRRDLRSGGVEYRLETMCSSVKNQNRIEIPWRESIPSSQLLVYLNSPVFFSCAETRGAGLEQFWNGYLCLLLPLVTNNRNSIHDLNKSSHLGSRCGGTAVGGAQVMLFLIIYYSAIRVHRAIQGNNVRPGPCSKGLKI